MAIDLGIRHLRAVVAVADHGTFTAAAARLEVAQPSLSRTVADLERRVGVPVFARSTRRVTLTEDGRHVVEVARHAVAEFDRALADVEGYLAGTRGTVVVGALPSVASTLLPAVVLDVRRTHPGIDVRVRDGLLGETVAALGAGDVDLALVGGEVPDLGGVERRPVVTERFACVMSTDHPLASHPVVRPVDLEGEAFVDFGETSSVRAQVDGMLADAGVRTGPRTQARTIGSVAGLVSAGLGVSLVPALVLPMMGFAHVTHRWVEGVADRTVSVVLRRGRPVSPAAAALLTTLADAPARGLPLPEGCRWVPTSDAAGERALGAGVAGQGRMGGW